MATTTVPSRPDAVEAIGGTDATRPLSWPRLLLWAAAGTVLAILIIIPPNLQTHDGLVSMIYPAQQGSSVAVIHQDFPGLRLPPGVGADGQIFYVMARAPMHLRAEAASLDRPRYRAQRILLPLLAWALHPNGGGRGLIIALVLVNVAGIFLGAVASGAISASFGGPVAIGALFPLLPGALESLNLTTADALALALALTAIALDLRRRPRTAVVAAVAAVLAKESILLVLIGHALWRGRRAWKLAVIPGLVAFAWWCFLAVWLRGTPNSIGEFEPLRGFVYTVTAWLGGGQVITAVCVFGAMALGVFALGRSSYGGPFAYAVVLQLLFIVCLSGNVLYNEMNGTRASLPLFACGGLALVAAWRRSEPSERGTTVTPS